MIGLGIYRGSQLGNIMFPVAALNYKAYYWGKDICYLNIHNLIDNLITTMPHQKHAADYLKIFKNIDFDINKEHRRDTYYIARMPFEYTEFTPYDGLCYLGYFQSYKYFDRDYVKKLFEPSFSLDKWDYLFNDITCSIHVRRGDYIGLSNRFVNLTMDYYNKAISMMSVDRYLVFSDDIQWCRENFKGDKFIFVNEVNYVDMFLMSRCNYNIISNSSFAWWGAYLGSGRVIAPKNWFAPEYRSSKDLIPENWEVI